MIKQKNLFACGVQVHIRTASLKVNEFSHTHTSSTNCTLTIAKWGFELFKANYSFGEPLRSVGLRVINLKNHQTANQLDLFGNSDDDTKLEKVEDSIYSVRQKFGNKSLKRGTNI